MGVADHVLESISGHLSRRVLEHSHIRIDAKRQALDALDAARRAPGNDFPQQRCASDCPLNHGV